MGNAESRLKSRYLREVGEGGRPWGEFVDDLRQDEFFALLSLPKSPSNAEVALASIASANVIDLQDDMMRNVAMFVTRIFDIQNYACAISAGIIDPNDISLQSYFDESDDFRAEIEQMLNRQPTPTQNGE